MAALVVLNGARAGAVFELPDMPTVVGRSPEAHFQLDDPWISSMHAMFERRGSELWLVDLQSRNGTFVGAERIKEALLLPGQVLRFGRTEVRLEKRATRSRIPAGPHPTPPSIVVTRPTGRLDAPEVTGSIRVIPEARDPLDPLPLGNRTVALLRMTIHLSSSALAPDPEILRAAVETLHRSALNEGGLVVRLGASGLLAVFGATDPSAEDADLALRAAKAACEELDAQPGGLAARAAVEAGTVCLGNMSGADGFELAVLGEVAERVDRVLALAGPGEILIGPGALHAVKVPHAARRQVRGEEIGVARKR